VLIEISLPNGLISLQKLSASLFMQISGREVCKDHLKTQNSVSKWGRICFLAVINSRKTEGKVFPASGNSPEVSLLGCEVAESTTLSYSTSQGLSLCPSPASLQMVSWYWLFSSSFSVKSLYTCLYMFAYKLKIKIVTGLPWAHFQI